MKLSTKRINRIKELRMDGLSLKEISKQTGEAYSTINRHCKGLRENNAPNMIPAIKANQERTEKEREKIRLIAREKWGEVKTNPTIIGLLGLYWGEGSKRTKFKSWHFRLTNSDPGVIKAGSYALSELGWENQFCRVQINDMHDVKECKSFWENTLQLTVRSIYQYNRRGNKPLRSKHGICVLCVENSRDLWITIIEWLKCWREDLNVYDDCQL